MSPFATKDLLVTSLSSNFELDDAPACDPTDTCTNRGSTRCPNTVAEEGILHPEHKAAFEALRSELAGAGA